MTHTHQIEIPWNEIRLFESRWCAPDMAAVGEYVRKADSQIERIGLVAEVIEIPLDLPKGLEESRYVGNWRLLRYFDATYMQKVWLVSRAIYFKFEPFSFAEGAD